MSIARIDAKKFIAGEWTTVSRLGDWPQIKLTEKLVNAANANYSEDFEIAVVNFDHASKEEGKGPAHAKVKDVRLLGDQVQMRCHEFTDFAKAKILGGEYFRPSIEIYPSHPQLPDKGAYWKGLGLMGNGAAQVRGTPKKFTVAGVEYAGLSDDTGDYIALDAADWRDPMLTDDKKTPPTPSAEEVARLAAETKAKDDRIAQLEAENAAIKKASETTSSAVVALQATVATLQTNLVEQKKEKRSSDIRAKLAQLEGEQKVSPGMVEVWFSILTADVEGIVKLGAGENEKTFTGAAQRADAVLYALGLGAPIIQMGDRMPDINQTHPGLNRPPQNANEAAMEADRLTEVEIAAGRIKRDTPQALAFFTEKLTGFQNQVIKFQEQQRARGVAV